MVILTTPLIVSSLNVNLYHIHNLPMLHPTLEIQVEYELEGTYFATHMHGMYTTIPKETNIKLCMTQGHLCMFEEPLYPVDKLNWCICHTLEMMCMWQRPHMVLPSVAPNTMHMGTDQKAQ